MPKIKRKWVVFGVFLLLIICLFSYRSYNLNNLNDISETAKGFLEEEGYFILKYNGEYGPYLLTEKDLIDEPLAGVWAVQETAPDKYINQRLTHEFFYILHPVNKLGPTHVTVIMHDDKPIGGFTTHKGDVRSLSGKTADELAK